MESSDGQEKTEEASEKRKRESKEKGQVARSKELNTLINVLGTTFFLILFSHKFAIKIIEVFRESFAISHDEVFDKMFFVARLSMVSTEIFYALLPLFITMIALSAIAPLLIGGFIFSTELCMPNLQRLDPISGLQKIVSLKSLMELLKSILKVCVIVIVFLIAIYNYAPEISRYDLLEVNKGIIHAMDVIMQVMLMLSLSLVFIVLIDVPYQLWDHLRQIKMTKQEVKDEHKNTEGNPEVRGKIRQLQQEMRKRRMMSDVPKADVVITNPEHFAVALQYDEFSMKAPIVIAKGADLIAGMIKKVAKANNVPMVEAPILARAIFFNVEMDEEIPSGLYVAVARVLGYVYELKLSKEGKADIPMKPTEFDIPKNMRTE